MIIVVKKWGKNTRSNPREAQQAINGKVIPKDQAQEFSEFFLRTQGTAASIEEVPRMVNPRFMRPSQDDNASEGGQTPHDMRRGGDTSQAENARPCRPTGGTENPTEGGQEGPQIENRNLPSFAQPRPRPGVTGQVEENEERHPRISRERAE